ncbi:ABC-type antimicrobial peptide transport system permease subunit [Spirosoma lacussanchae]|uniref:ABC transporter permease n=1 Tax=Spirosoma lacussanchae TaxID=1884249 RepID=UPI001108D03A|nr:ABC transporter permease [Spirosoma lacussanchae]
MIRNYLKIAFRTLWKHKTHTGINVVGLAVAFATATLLFLTSWFEWSYDRFHTDVDRIYRVYLQESTGDVTSIMPYPLSPALQAEMADAESVTRMMWSQTEFVGEKHVAKDIRFADPGVFRTFTFPLLAGDPNTALKDLSSIVITEDMARDLFGDQNPIGKPLRTDGLNMGRDFIVTGVLANIPTNSTFRFDALVRPETRVDYQANKAEWGNRNHEVFVRLKPGVDAQTAEKRLRSFTKKYWQSEIAEAKQRGQKPDAQGEYISLRLQPLTDIRFDTKGVMGGGVSRTYVYALALIGLFILLIAGINYVNLSLARSVTRAREVGVRKSLGAQSGQLLGQFWAESLVICLIALLAGVGLAVGLRPYYNQLFGTRLSFDLLTHPITVGCILVAFLFITLLTGGYPAWIMARFEAVTVLKGKVKGPKSGGLRSILIVAQFALASLLIICTLLIGQQLRYLRERPLGFSEEQVISLPLRNRDNLTGARALQQLRDRLRNNPDVVSISGTATNLGSGLDGSTSRSMSGWTYKNREVETDWLRVDFDYLKTLGMSLKAGRDFNPAFSTDTVSAVIITQSMAKQLGEKDPVGVVIQPDTADRKYEIIGVIPDFNLFSLHQKAKPITLHLDSRNEVSYALIRTTPQGMVRTMDALKSLWKEMAPSAPFQASFVNENTNRWYDKEERFSTIFRIAAGLTILLSCMGLFAVALLTIEQRTKEIGVRKVLGASVTSIVALLSKDFLKLVVIAIVIASPLAWYAMNQWLQDFAYKIDIEWWVFGLAGLLAVGIALLTVSVQSIKAALMNPVRSLRSD